jgi:Ca-activated chloride channel family protein
MRTTTSTPCISGILTGWMTWLIRLTGAFALYALFGLLADVAYAASGTADPLKATNGSVWLHADNGRPVEALLLETEVDIDVTGMIARARIKQRFQNTLDIWAEGTYVFPLPENAAVDHFRLQTGGRSIEGQVQERTAARQVYETARNQGKQAALMEQQRPNVFTTSIANIAPHDTLTVEIEYQQTIAYRDGRYRLRIPLVTGPRYHALAPNPADQDDKTDVGVVVADKPVNSIYLHVMLDAGVPLSTLDSTYHEIDVLQTDSNRYSIALRDHTAFADRDFELTWSPEPDRLPRAAVFSQRHKGHEYALVSILPPDLQSLGQQLLPRDVVFILDVSGSMSGAPIEQARSSLIHALARLKAGDRFNLIWFNDRTERLYPGSVPATDDNIRYASQFIDRLQADGGTVMKPALVLALNDQPDSNRLRQIVFITDGNVDNEKELFALIDKRLGGNRLFTVGIGSAPNGHFMRKSARSGRGSYTFIGKLDEVEARTRTLFKQMESPALVDIDVGIEGESVEIFPQPVPDLYLGEPLTVLIRGKRLGDTVSVSGDYGESLWRQDVRLEHKSSHPGISTAWAREKVTTLMERHHDADSKSRRESLKNEIVRLSLDHHLVSRFTSLVAVDTTPVNSSGLLYSEKLKTSLPHGWDPARRPLPTGQQVLLAQLALPQTATGAAQHGLTALMLFALAMVFYFWRKLL